MTSSDCCEYQPASRHIRMMHAHIHCKVCMVRLSMLAHKLTKSFSNQYSVNLLNVVMSPTVTEEMCQEQM